MGSSGEADQLKDLSKDIDASGSEIKSVPSINLSINDKYISADATLWARLPSYILIN